MSDQFYGPQEIINRTVEEIYNKTYVSRDDQPSFMQASQTVAMARAISRL